VGCGLIQGTLVAYYFGTADDEVRAATDAHLISCKKCLSAYLEIKRHAEAPADEAPSDALQARLRADIAAIVQPPALARVRRWMAGPVPRYKIASVAAVLVILAALAARESAPQPEPLAGTRLDTARTSDGNAGAY